MRVKIVKSGSKYKVGDTLVLSPNEAFGLIDSGFAIKSKDLTVVDYKTKQSVSKKRG